MRLVCDPAAREVHLRRLELDGNRFNKTDAREFGRFIEYLIHKGPAHEFLDSFGFLQIIRDGTKLSELAAVVTREKPLAWSEFLSENPIPSAAGDRDDTILDRLYELAKILSKKT